ncbi:zinc finger protein 862-like [Oscarella lobularis]|uniref:zinc finger protein 862-like n=1 Tax=Oscarella lobularis TaxID=121494 RepID=UPI0033136D47
MSIHRFFKPADDAFPSSKRPKPLNDSSSESSSESDVDISAVDLVEAMSSDEGDVELLSTAGKSSSSKKSRKSSSSTSSKQSGGFRSEWRVGRMEWLRYDSQSKGMLCVLCQKHDKTADRAPWTSIPCTRLRLESVKRHEKSAIHRQCVKMENESQRSNVTAMVNPQIASSGIEDAFACLYFLCKRKIAHTTNFEPLMNFAEYLGVKIKEKIGTGRNALYTSEQSIHEMIVVLAEVIENDILSKVRKSKFYSIMLDETTDCTVTEQLSVHARFIDEEGKLCSSFLKIIDLLQPEIESLDSAEEDTRISAGAETVTKRVLDFLDVHSLDGSKIVGIGTDGASVMIGCRNGVVKRMQNVCKAAVGIHCAAHRLNLASTQAANSVPYVKKFNSVLRQLFDYYDNSAVRSAGLEAIRKLLQEKGKLVAPSQTRWLSVEKCASQIKSAFTSLAVSLQREGIERSDAKALGLNALITDIRFVKTLLLMCDALPIVSHLSKCFQSSSVDFSMIQPMISSSLEAITELKLQDGRNMQELPDFLLRVEGAGIDIKHAANFTDAQFKEQIKMPFLTNLIDNINRRFAESNILAAFSIFNASLLPYTQRPSPNEEERRLSMQYGNNNVSVLAEQFLPSGAIEGVDECLQEWFTLKAYMRKNWVSSDSSMSQKEVIEKLCKDFTLIQIFPNLSQLARICRTLPIHTADVERSFSQLKLVKTRIRNRLKEDTLDALLRIAVEGPDVDQYPFHSAVLLWAKKKKRRIFRDR